MCTTELATSVPRASAAARNEELIKHLEYLSGVLSELKRREQGSQPPWLRRGLLEADYHLLSAQVALQDLQQVT